MKKSEATRIMVAARVRPLNRLEREQGGEECLSLEDKSVSIRVEQETHNFTFDHVFGSGSTQQEVFEAVAQPVVEKVMQGYNGTIFAYGQTSSGKTYTMEGLSLHDEHNKGIIPRMMAFVFAFSNDSPDRTYRLECSFLEIYNERINDLLDQKKNNLQVKEDRQKGIYVGDATEVLVEKESQMQQVIIQGNNNRSVASTRMNENSSRSHSLFILNVTQKNNQGQQRNSRLYFVDLAGSEKIAKTNVTGKQLEEAKNINKSLSALGNVINSLTSSNKNQYIPYRDSKLTRILQESLGGNSSTSIIIALSMCSYNDKESLSTLRFGQRAKTIKNRVSQNVQYTNQQLLQMVGQYKAQLVSQESMIQDYLKEIHNLSQISTHSFSRSPRESFDLNLLNDSTINQDCQQQQEQSQHFQQNNLTIQQHQEQSLLLQQENANLSQVSANQQEQINDIKRQKKKHHLKLLQKIREIQDLNNKNRELQEQVNSLEEELFTRNQEIDELKQRENENAAQNQETLELYKQQLSEKQDIQKEVQRLRGSQHRINECVEALRDQVNYIIIGQMMGEEEEQPSMDRLSSIQKLLEEMKAQLSPAQQNLLEALDKEGEKAEQPIREPLGMSAIQPDQSTVHLIEKYEIKKNEWHNKINYYKEQLDNYEHSAQNQQKEQKVLQGEFENLALENGRLKEIIQENQEQKKMYENQLKISRLQEENITQQKILIQNEQEQLKQQQLIQQQYSNQRQLQQNIDLLLNKIDLLSSFNQAQAGSQFNRSLLSRQSQTKKRHRRQNSHQHDQPTSRKGHQKCATQQFPADFQPQESLYSFRQSSRASSAQPRRCEHHPSNKRSEPFPLRSPNQKRSNVVRYQIEYTNRCEKGSVYSQVVNPFSYISQQQRHQWQESRASSHPEDSPRGTWQRFKAFLLANQYRIPAVIAGAMVVDLYICHRRKL